MQLTLRDEIATQLKARVQQSQEFVSVEEYVNYILEEVLKQTSGTKDAYTKDQEQEVKKRLEDLGYLD